MNALEVLAIITIVAMGIPVVVVTIYFFLKFIEAILELLP